MWWRIIEGSEASKSTMEQHMAAAVVIEGYGLTAIEVVTYSPIVT